ncbi:MAG TPA: dihydropteroate synthase [Aestuariivirgaceae bacterium]|nr:dihydropteroate synthase [Aestuariivirgaceae bacterium]
MTQIYIRPIGLLWGEDAEAAIAETAAGRIAGGSTAFTLAEIISRNGREIRREMRSYKDISRSGEKVLRERLALIEAARAPIAGIEMAEPSIMGIINVTPDSFSDGGEAATLEDALARGLKLAEEGARIIDVGGESTRPGSEAVSVDEERSRVLTVVGELSARGYKISIDTRKPAIMQEAVRAGAAMINDVTALRFDADSRAMVARLKCPVCLMHAQGDPKTMQINPVYEDVVLDVFDGLEEFIAEAERAGLPRSMILADPGIGFGKTYRHNLDILRSLTVYHGLGVPLVIGASRKAFIGALTGEKTGKDRVSGSIGAAMAAASQGVQILRVHDVRATAQALKVWRACIKPSSSGI